MGQEVGRPLEPCHGVVARTPMDLESLAPCPVQDLGRSLPSEELLDEDDHLVLLDGTGLVLVEGGEDLVEGLLGELVTGAEVTESVLNEFLGLFLIEGAGLVDIVSFPNLVDNALDSLFFRSCHFLLLKLVKN